MSLSSYNPHTRYRDRAAQRMVNFFKFSALIFVLLLIGFWFGKQYSAQHLITLKERIMSLESERDMLQDNVTELSAKAQTAEKRYSQLQEEVNSIIPKGPMQDLVTLVREQLQQGMDPQRLAFVLRSARPPTGCTPPETKRFVIHTPAHQGPVSTVTIGDNIIVSGTGKSARNANKQPEAWYDPAKAVKIHFKNGDNPVESKAGGLPLRYSLVSGDREYRFTIESGARSFAKVIFDSCNYP